MNQTAIQEIRPWERPFWRPARGKAGVLFYLVLIHVLAVTGLILYPLPSLKIMGITLLFTALGGFGTTVCYHRLLAHRTLKLNKAIEHFLIFWATFNGSGAPASWVAYHRHHHSRTDTPEDVSSPKQGGFWWAHLRWLYQSAPADRQKPQWSVEKRPTVVRAKPANGCGPELGSFILFSPAQASPFSSSSSVVRI